MATQQDPKTHWRATVSGPLNLSAYYSASAPHATTLDIGARSVAGLQHPQNTDHYLVMRLARLQETIVTSLSPGDLPPRFEESAYAMLVADGLDPGGAGARASRLAVSTLAHLAIKYGKWNVRISSETPAEIVEQGEFFWRQVRDTMAQESRLDLGLARMATSLTAAYIAGSNLFFAHMGHSRAFLFRGGVLIQLTMEHTLERLISASAALRRLRLEARTPHVAEDGTTRSSEVAIEHVQLWPGDRILLCTNGLTDVVGDEQISDALAAQRHPDEDTQRLVDIAVSLGATDDVTVLLADYRIPAPPLTLAAP